MSTTTSPIPVAALAFTCRVEVAPVANWPYPLAPKHDTPPAVNDAHVKSKPVDTRFAVPESETAVGVAFDVVVMGCDS